MIGELPRSVSVNGRQWAIRTDYRDNCMMICTPSKAEFICTRDGTSVYHPGWLNTPPESAVYDEMPEGMVAYEIEAEEFQSIIEALDAGNVPTEPEDPDPETPTEDPDTPPTGSVAALQEWVVSKMSSACAAAITAGVDVTLSDGSTGHYSLTLEDQLNLLSLQGMLQNGEESVPYHADGEECRYYSATDFNAIATAATGWKLYQESYFNSLRAYIQSLTTTAELLAVQYGMEIPQEYQTEVLQSLKTA